MKEKALEKERRHTRELGLLAEMQRKFKPYHAGKVLQAMVARVNQQIAETDVAKK